jgi:hypothetical protein
VRDRTELVSSFWMWCVLQVLAIARFCEVRWGSRGSEVVAAVPSHTVEGD